MFLNEDSIKKRIISYNKNDVFFKDNEKIINFDDIKSYFHQETKYTTNSVYEGTKLELILILNNGEKYNIEIDSKKQEKFNNIYLLSYAIQKFRFEKLTLLFDNNQTIIFDTQYNNMEIHLNKNESRIIFQNKLSHYNPLIIKNIIQNKNYITFRNKENRKESLCINQISDSILFLSLISQNDFFVDETSKNNKLDTKLYWLFIFLLVVLGINNWFEICCMDNDIIKTLSKLASFFLMLILILSPFYWLVFYFNSKKIDKEKENLYKKYNEDFEK